MKNSEITMPQKIVKCDEELGGKDELNVISGWY